ncbi:hypothetical protein A4A49_60662, partial [Nicotiana attenuata]
MTVIETTSKTMEENIKKLENQLQNHIAEAGKKANSMDAKMDGLAEQMGLLMEKLLPNQAGLLGSVPADAQHLDGQGNRTRMDQYAHSMTMERPYHNHHSNSSSRVDEFPYFDGATGSDPCSWLRRCERYFHFNHITVAEHKLEEAVLHLNGRAESWYFSYQ